MHGITPDIVTMAKGIGNGFPLGAVVTKPKIAAALRRAGHFNTYGGNPIACTIGMTVLDVSISFYLVRIMCNVQIFLKYSQIIEEEQLQRNSKEIGTYMLKQLAELRDIYPLVGDVRGKGLMIGVELVRGDGSTAPLDPKRFMRFWENCRKMGLIIGKGGQFGNVM